MFVVNLLYSYGFDKRETLPRPRGASYLHTNLLLCVGLLLEPRMRIVFRSNHVQ